ncbi:MAG: hypothetical protein RXN93_00015 [Thermocladium sp.]
MRIFIIVTLFALVVASVGTAQYVYINQYGVPQVIEYINLTNATIVAINPPIKPINGTIMVTNGTEYVPFVALGNGSIAIFAFGNGLLNVTYSANFTVAQNSTFMTCYDYDAPLNVTYSINALPVMFPSPINYSIKSNVISMTLPPGNHCVQYVVIPTSEPGETITSSESLTSSSMPQSSITSIHQFTFMILAIIIVVIVIGVIILLRRSR